MSGAKFNLVVLWMGEILHHLTPGMIRFIDANTNKQWFPMASKWCGKVKDSSPDTNCGSFPRPKGFITKREWEAEPAFPLVSVDRR